MFWLVFKFEDVTMRPFLPFRRNLFLEMVSFQGNQMLAIFGEEEARKGSGRCQPLRICWSLKITLVFLALYSHLWLELNAFLNINGRPILQILLYLSLSG